MDDRLPVSNKSLLVPDVGSMIQIITQCTKTPVDSVVGKPTRFAFDIMSEEHGSMAEYKIFCRTRW